METYITFLKNIVHADNKQGNATTDLVSRHIPFLLFNGSPLLISLPNLITLVIKKNHGKVVASASLPSYEVKLPKGKPCCFKIRVLAYIKLFILG